MNTYTNILGIGMTIIGKLCANNKDNNIRYDAVIYTWILLNQSPLTQKLVSQLTNIKRKKYIHMKYIPPNNIPVNKPNRSYPGPPSKKVEPEIVHIPSQVIAQQPIPFQLIDKQKSEFDNPIQEELVSMGFEKEYVIRACNLYKKKFTNQPLRLEVLNEIIIRVQQRDQNRNRAKSIDSVAAPVKNKQNINKNNNGNQGNHCIQIKYKTKTFYIGASASAQKMQDLYSNAQLQQSMSYDYNLPNNGYGKGNDNINNNGNSNGESVAITIIMPSSSIGLQTCDIIIRKDQTLQDAKQLISTCLMKMC